MPKPSRRALSRPYDIITIGSGSQDVFLESHAFEKIRDPDAPDGFDACVPLGSKLAIDRLTVEIGGGAVNAAVTLRRFGYRTACLTRLGTDAAGIMLRSRLATEKIDCSLIQEDAKLPTAYSVILLSDQGFRSILAFRGAANALSHRDIPWEHISTDWIYLASTGGNATFLKQLFMREKKNWNYLAWNPGNGEIALGLSALKPFLAKTAFLILNRNEAAELAHCPPRDLSTIFDTLGPLPRYALAVTDGQHGAYVYSRGSVWHARPISAPRRNTTGAGDAFGSALTAVAARTGDIETGLRAGTLNAASVISHMGATAGILKSAPSTRELNRVRVTMI